MKDMLPRSFAGYMVLFGALVALGLSGAGPPEAAVGSSAAQPPTPTPSSSLIEIGPNWVSLGPAPVVSGAALYSEHVLSPPVSGRATVLAVNPENRYNVWLGTAGGGLWVTNNQLVGGLAPGDVKPDPTGTNFDRNWQPVWHPLNDGFPSLAIGGIVLDEADCDAYGCLSAYVGTGENSLRRDTYYGDGVYRVTYVDTGEFPRWTWHRLDTSEQFKYGSTAGLVLDGDELFVALSAGNTTTSVYANVRAPEPAAGYGVHRRDSAGNWTQIFATTSAGGERWEDLLLPTDLEKDPGDADGFLLGVMNDGIFRTNDRGATWCALNPGSRLLLASQSGDIPTTITDCSAGTGLPPAGSFDHVELAAASATTLYAMFGNCPSSYTEGAQGGTSLCKDSSGTNRSPFFYKSMDGGTSWSQPGSVTGAHYSRYTHALTPTSGEQVLWGGLHPNVLNTGAGGFSAIPLWHDSLHWDVHDLAAFAGWDAGSGVVYAATDGGFYFLAQGTGAWSPGNDSLITTAFVGIALDYEDEPDDDYPRTTAILGGLQDNSNAAYNGSEKWQLWGPVGDGGEALIQSPTITFDSIQDNVIRRIPGFGAFSASVSGPVVNSEEDIAFYSPLVQHETTKRVFVGTDVVSVREGTPAAWDPAGGGGPPSATQISPVLGTDGNNFPAIETDRDLITALAVAPSHGWRVYAGLYSGQLWRSTTAAGVQPSPTSADWEPIDDGLPAGTISSIAVHPTDEDRLWVAFSDFMPQTVWFSDNAGGDWEARSSGLMPGEPVNVIKVVPDEPAKLWLGTDSGVFLSTDSGLHWEPRKANLPQSPVFDLEIDWHTNRIFVATHGRGAWMLADEGPLLTTFEGWTEHGIWDIPIYGTGFTCSGPGDCMCTVEIVREDGSVCASGNVDAIGNSIFVPQDGTTLRTENMGSCTRCEGKPVVWGCFNGQCVGGGTLAACNAGGHRVAGVRVDCDDNPVATGSVAGACPVQSDPPSNLFEVTPGLTLPGAATAGADALSPAASPRALFVAPTVMAPPDNGGDRALCSALLEYDADDVAGAQLDLRDAINGSVSCQAAGVGASLVQETPLTGEDTPGEPDLRLALSAPGIAGNQMVLGVNAPPGDAAGLCFDMSRLGVYLGNQVLVSQVSFLTEAGGAEGGEIVVVENSPVGSCAMRVPTTPGQTGEQIAAAVATAFQTPGVPAPGSCPESNNPRDIIQEGDSVIAVLPTNLRVCIEDEGVGFGFNPHGVDVRPPKPRFEYAAKIVCGVQEDPDDMRLASGFYATSVNMHNPHARDVVLSKKLALTYPPGEQAPGEVLPIGSDLLGHDQALKTDCMDIRQRLFAGGFPAPYIEGFVVIQSSDSLDVAGLYTTAALGEDGRAGAHSSLHLEQIPGRRIEESPPGEPEEPEAPDIALLCYEGEAAQETPAIVDLRTQFGLHRRVTLEQPVSLCEPVYKAHEEESLPEESPPMLPLTCYKMTGENAQAQVQLADHNGFYDGQAVVGQPQIFCDPAEKKVRRQETPEELAPFPTPLTGYTLRAETLPEPAVVFTRDQFGVRKLTFRRSALLLDGTTKNDPQAPLPEQDPFHCYRIEQPEPMDESVVLVDQFGEHEMHLGIPTLFCDPAVKTQPVAASTFTQREAQQFSADVPLAWFDLTYELVQSEKVSPPVASRIFGYAGVALYEVLVPGMPGYQSLTGQLNQLEMLPRANGEGYHWPTVVNATMATILTDLFEGRSGATHTAIAALEHRFARQFAAGLPPEVFNQSVKWGQQVGKAIAIWARSDGYETLQNCAYTPPTGPGLWEPTPPDYVPALEPCWGQLRPFILASTDVCRVDPPPAYSRDPTSVFYQEAREVYDAVMNLTPEQKTVALYWADSPGETGTPPGHSISIVGQVIEQQGYTLDVAAEAYARAGIAVADSFISCWSTKYEYNLVRPVTYIQHLVDDDWNPVVVTPPFSEYTSGHSVQSIAVARVLTDLFGEIPFTDHTHDSHGFVPRSFNTFLEFAEEAAISRLYGGIHYRSAIERGIEQGKCIGKKVSAIGFRNP